MIISMYCQRLWQTTSDWQWLGPVLNGIGNFDSIGSHLFHFDFDSIPIHSMQKPTFYSKHSVYSWDKKHRCCDYIDIKKSLKWCLSPYEIPLPKLIFHSSETSKWKINFSRVTRASLLFGHVDFEGDRNEIKNISYHTLYYCIRIQYPYTIW